MRVSAPPRAAFTAAVVATIVFLDQASKMWATRTLFHSVPIVVFDSWFRLVYHRNSGGVFGFLAGPSSTGRKLFFVAATVVALLFILHLLKEWGSRSTTALVGLSLITGGATGNLIDRVAYGEVIDFIDWHWRGHHWPTFNVADSAITVGTILLLIFTLLSKSAADKGGE